MNRQPGVHYLHEHRQSGAPPKMPAEVGRIRETVVAGLGDLVQGAFDAVDDSLFELANNARSNNEQNRYFEAMREIRIKRRGVEKAFKESVANLFVNPPRSGSSLSRDGDQSKDDLALVGHDELEEQVALNAMITKSESYFQGPLLQLQTRFSNIYPGASEDNPINPMAPEHLCHAFMEAAQTLEIQIRERLIVLKQFDRYVISNLGMLLDEANRILIQAGVIPNFRYHARKSESAPENEAPQGQAPTGEAASRPSQSQTRTTQASDDAFFTQISELLRAKRPSLTPTSAASSGGVHVLSDQELNQLINALPQVPQEARAGENLSKGEPVAVDIRQTITHLLEQQRTADGKPAALEQSDEDLINLVSMLFEFILEDYNLSAPIQVLISRLQIPILKVVIRDRSFFSQATHPARKLLNALARAGIGWSDSDEKTRDKLYDQIHAIVSRILDEYDGDIGLFEQLGEEFEQFLARENRKAALVEQRTRESERGRIKSQKAQETVDELLRKKLSNAPVPEAVRRILTHGWSRVMFLAFLRDDVEHRWDQTVRVVDDLIWCLHPRLDDEERDQWVRVVPGLLKTIRAGLEEVSYNTARLDDMMGELKHELTEAFRHHAQAEAREPQQPEAHENSAEDDDNKAEDDQPLTAIQRQQMLEDAASAEYLSQIDEIAIGNWVEFNLVNGSRFRCKLSAIIDEADCLVFVNRMGLKVVEKTRSELAHELRQGRLTILEQGALIDRAMEAVMGSLRREAG